MVMSPVSDLCIKSVPLIFSRMFYTLISVSLWWLISVSSPVSHLHTKRTIKCFGWHRPRFRVAISLFYIRLLFNCIQEYCCCNLLSLQHRHMFHGVGKVIVLSSINHWFPSSSSLAISLYFIDNPRVLYLLKSLFKVSLDILLLYFLNYLFFGHWTCTCSICDMLWNINLQNKSTVIIQVTLIERVDVKTDYTANCPSAQTWNKNISKLICGLMLPFNAVSNKSFIKLMITTDGCFSQALLWKVVLPLIEEVM